MLNINPTLLGSVVGVGLACSVILHEPSPAHAEAAEAAWVIPDVDKLPNDDWGRAVRYGRDLIVRTAALIGPEVSDPAHRFSGNNMNCQNCHLEAGTKEFGFPLVGVFADFPNYRAREGEVGTIEDRVQGCMERSMNGRRLPPDGREMTSIVAYLKFLSTGRPVGAQTVGRGVGKISELARAADPAHGQSVYVQTCSACHGDKGQGQRVGNVGDAQGYAIPPLWGPDSFNDGAGMTRLTNAANFVHSNMPNGATWQQPALSPGDAWDVAAFVDSQPRPHKSDLENDYPKRLEKPVDTPYGPYADSLAAAEHKLGPFQPIRDAIKRLATSPSQTQSAP
jgi:thiosulfate dehydrogenase